MEPAMTDVLPELTHADHAWPWCEKRGMERELFDALARPWVKNASTRAIDALLDAGIHTRAEIVKRGSHEMLMVKNLGPTLLAFIRERLNAAVDAEHTELMDDPVAVDAVRLLIEKGYTVADVVRAWPTDTRRGGA